MKARPYPTVTTRKVQGSRDRFRRWVAIFGISRLSHSMKLTRWAVNSWVKRVDPVMPHSKHIARLVALSVLEPLPPTDAAPGPLSYEDILGIHTITETRTHNPRTSRRVHP